MTPNGVEVYEVVIEDQATDDIKRFVRKKKFYSLPKQIKEVIEDFQQGRFHGDNVLTYDEPTHVSVYKMRLPNPDTGAGKSNGYRVLYAVAVEHKLVVILTVYYKKEVATIRDSAIRGMIDSFVSEQFSKNEETDR